MQWPCCTRLTSIRSIQQHTGVCVKGNCVRSTVMLMISPSGWPIRHDVIDHLPYSEVKMIKIFFWRILQFVCVWIQVPELWILALLEFFQVGDALVPISDMGPILTQTVGSGISDNGADLFSSIYWNFYSCLSFDQLKSFTLEV